MSGQVYEGVGSSDGAWGGFLPVPLEDVAAVHLVGADGRPVLVAPSS